MRPILIAFVLVVAPIAATAGSSSGGGGGGSGGGRLAAVSAGIGGATSGGGGTRGGGSSSMDERHWAVPCSSDQYRRRVYDGRCERRCPEGELYREHDGACLRPRVAVVVPPDAALEVEDQNAVSSQKLPGAQLTGYVGAQKVFESDGAVALELAVSDRWLRLGGGLTRFYERQQNGDTLTMTMPSLALGARISDTDNTRVYLEAGVVGAVTRNDPVMDSSITGGLGGVVAEHSLSKHTMLVGAARVMAFQHDVRATSARVGVRHRHVQASFSVLDFNVGPALYGPELGIGF